MARKRNELGGISQDSAEAYAEISENRPLIFAQAANLRANMGEDVARRYIEETCKIPWEEFQAYLKTIGNGSTPRGELRQLPLAERLTTAIDEIIASTRIQNALGIFVVADLEGKSDAFLLAKQRIGETTIAQINRALHEKLEIERTPDGQLHDCNGTES